MNWNKNQGFDFFVQNVITRVIPPSSALWDLLHSLFQDKFPGGASILANIRGWLSFHFQLQVPTFPYCRVENLFHFNSCGAVFWGDKGGCLFASTLPHPSDPKGLCPFCPLCPLCPLFPVPASLARCAGHLQLNLGAETFVFSRGTKLALLPLKHIPGKPNEINSEPVPTAWCSQPENLELLLAETAPEPQTTGSHWQVIG